MMIPAPLLANALATARPTPIVEPVTKATFEARNAMTAKLT